MTCTLKLTYDRVADILASSTINRSHGRALICSIRTRRPSFPFASDCPVWESIRDRDVTRKKLSSTEARAAALLP